MPCKRVERICEVLQDTIKDTRSELNYINEYTFLVAVVLSAQTTDKQVNSVTGRLFALVQTPQAMLELGEGKLCELIKSTGFYKNKAKHVIQLSEKLICDFGGQVPQTRVELMSLPGVGPKTANVILNQLFKQPTIAVDTHVFRVSRRLGLSSGKSPKDVESDLEKCIPNEYKAHIGDQLLLHGRYTCTARKPKCETCKLKEFCKDYIA